MRKLKVEEAKKKAPAAIAEAPAEEAEKKAGSKVPEALVEEAPVAPAVAGSDGVEVEGTALLHVGINSQFSPV